MRSPLPIRRGLDVLAPVTLYRAIGRRPSRVYVDEQRHAFDRDGAGKRHRLWDLVYERYEARPGDQLQDRQGGIMLVTRDGECCPVQLSEPCERTAEHAFTHADRALAADWTVIEGLIADGLLEVGSIRRTKQMPFNPAQVRLDEGHPLVVEKKPRRAVTADQPPAGA